MVSGNPFEKYIAKSKSIEEKSNFSKKDFSLTKPQFTSYEHKFLINFFKNYVEKISIKLSDIIQKKIIIELSTIDVLQFSDYIDFLPNPSIIIRIDIEGTIISTPKALVIIDPYVIFILLNLLLGSKGEAPTYIRELTKLETKLLQQFIIEEIINEFNLLLGTLDDSNKKTYFKLEKISTEPASALAIPYTSYVAKVNTIIRIESLESLKTIILPFNYLREIIPEQKPTITTSINPDILNKIIKDKEKILSEKNLSLSKVDVIAILGKTEVLFQDLLYIEPGDIITLDNKLTDPVMVKIEGKTKFLGSLGMVGNKIGIKITKVLTDQEAEEYE